MKNVKNSTIACRDAHESVLLLRMDLQLQGSWCSYALQDCA